MNGKDSRNSVLANSALACTVAQLWSHDQLNDPATGLHEHATMMFSLSLIWGATTEIAVAEPKDEGDKLMLTAADSFSTWSDALADMYYYLRDTTTEDEPFPLPHVLHSAGMQLTTKTKIRAEPKEMLESLHKAAQDLLLELGAGMGQDDQIAEAKKQLAYLEDYYVTGTRMQQWVVDTKSTLRDTIRSGEKRPAFQQLFLDQLQLYANYVKSSLDALI